MHGNCLINQGLTYARANEGVVWVERGGPQGDPPHKVIAYLEGNVAIDYQEGENGLVKAPTGALKARVTDQTWFGRFHSSAPLKLRFATPSGPEPAVKPAVYEHGMEAREPKFRPPVKPVQFAQPNTGINGPGSLETLPPPAAAPAETVIAAPPAGTRRIRAFPRSDSRVQVQSFPNQAAGEQIIVFSSGVQLVVDGMDNFGSIDAMTDRMVIWTSDPREPLMGGDGMVQSEDTPLEMYLEGNIVFRQGDRTLYANRMYYDVRRQVGLVLDAELLGPVPTYQGAIRVKAKVLEQVGPDRFTAQGASFTSSHLADPGYQMKSQSMTLTDSQQPVINPLTGQAVIDPNTGAPVIAHNRRAEMKGNTVFVGPVPVFYWPTMATNLEEPKFYVDNFQFRQDRIFGTQVFLDVDAYQLLGIKNRIEGTTWDVSTDYLSMRGPALGTAFTFDEPSLFGIPGHSFGFFDAWGIHDDGHDNLGLNRRDLMPEKGPWRGRVVSRDRWNLPDNFRVTGELGLISDYNFQEQYFEQEWDQFKDYTTDLELYQIRNNGSWSLYGQVRLNDFYTETNWLPRFDHYQLGQSLLGDRLTWYEHTNVAYAQNLLQQPPTNAADLAQFGYLPWEPHLTPTVPGASPQGDREVTRQELDLPFEVGGVKVVPYVLGELAHWGQALDYNDLSRAYGQVGVRASVPFSSVNPTIQSQLFNLNGLTHKITFDVDVSDTQATSPVTDLPLYDMIDDQNINRYRQIFSFYDFGTPGLTPYRYDARQYALRYGLENYVASPSSEIAGDMLAARLGVRQRWQTKRGKPGAQHVVDWMTLDMQGVVFPDANRDNFGTSIGMVQYNYRWFLGDRTTVVSDGYFDFFGGGSKYMSVGMYLNRPPRGSLYTGLIVLQGPISTTVLATSYNYRMSPKWLSTLGSTIALSNSGNIGEFFGLTRIGESFLMNVSINVDASKGNVGANFSLEPRFLSKSILSASGAQIPAAGAYGLE